MTMNAGNDEVSLLLNNVRVTGWTSVRITRGIERCPADFEISMTERYPGELSEVTAVPGDECQVFLGNDLVVTGYLDRYMPSIDAGAHSITLHGRGKCQDLVDCSAEWPGSQISDSQALGVAEKLARPYGIKVTSDVNTNVVQQQFNIILSETAWSIIERVCRNAAVLVYETETGDLLLTRISKRSAASGFEEGVNIERAMAVYSMDQRYSEYHASALAYDFLRDVQTDPLQDHNTLFVCTDSGVKRHRRHTVIAEVGVGYLDITKKRALWARNRRMGRSLEIHLTTDGWRDSGGKLYTPNTLVPLTIPSLKIAGKRWSISEVTYLRDESGTRADLVIMAPEAFLPEPVILEPLLADVTANLHTPTP
jgi:prophage tail gpP-like protein